MVSASCRKCGQSAAEKPKLRSGACVSPAPSALLFPVIQQQPRRELSRFLEIKPLGFNPSFARCLGPRLQPLLLIPALASSSASKQRWVKGGERGSS